MQLVDLVLLKIMILISVEYQGAVVDVIVW
jgi:hypothetical protein